LVQECLETGLQRIEFLVLPILDVNALHSEPVETRDDPSPAKFERFERVLVSNKKIGEDHRMFRGAVLWRDYVQYSKYDRGFKEPPLRRWEWVYCIYLPDGDCCLSIDESGLQKTGEFDLEAAHLGKSFEISFDTVLDEDDGIEDDCTVEGCIRLPGRFWQIFLFMKSDVPELRHRFVTWPSRIESIEFEVPRAAELNQDYMVRALATAFDTNPESWVKVYGPDSLMLR
jgi:hypothetical protein